MLQLWVPQWVWALHDKAPLPSTPTLKPSKQP